MTAKRPSKTGSIKRNEALSLTPVANPHQRGTVGDIGVFFRVDAHRPFTSVRLELPYAAASRLESVDERTLHLFWWDEEKRSLALVSPSGVDLDKKVVWGTIHTAGIYGCIGLPTDSDLRRTLGVFALFSAEELRDSRALHLKVCGLILCADPGFGAPLGVCELCLGLEIPELHLPEVQILRTRPGWLFEKFPGPRLAAVWPTYQHDFRQTCQSRFNGPATVPSIEWSFTAPGSQLSPPVVASDGTVYIDARGTTEDLYALDGNTGAIKWSVQLVGAGMPLYDEARPAIGRDGTVYVNDGTWRLAAVSPSGAILWRFAQAGLYLRFPMPSPDGSIYVHCGGGGLPYDPASWGVLALSANGTRKWPDLFDIHDAQWAGGLYQPLAVRDDGSLIAVGTKVWALAANGAVLWTYPSAPASRLNSWTDPVVSDDGRVMVGASELIILNASGQQDVVVARSTFGISVARNGVVYSKDQGFTLAAITRAGSVSWLRHLPHPYAYQMPGSAAIGDDGTLYICARSQLNPTLENVLALDPATGQDLWGFTLPAGRLDKWLHPPVIGLDRRLFVVDINNGTLYSLR